MGKNLYALDDEDVAFLRRLRQEFTGSPLGHLGPFGYRPRPVWPKITKTGKVYTPITAGTANLAGHGEVKFDSLDTRDRSFGVEAELPTTVYNYSTREFAAGERVLCFLDRTASESSENSPDSKNPKNVWVVFDNSGDEYRVYGCKMNGGDDFETSGFGTDWFHVPMLQAVCDPEAFELVEHVNASDVGGFKALADGRYFILASLRLSAATAVSPVTLSVSAGSTEDLCPKMITKQGEFRIVLGDDPDDPQGVPSINQLVWRTQSLCGNDQREYTLQTFWWAHVNDVFRFALKLNEASASNSGTWAVNVSAIYFGDHGTDWEDVVP